METLSKISMTFFCRNRKLILKFTCNLERPQNHQYNLEKQNKTKHKAGRDILSDYKTYHKLTVIKIIRLQHNDRYIEQWNKKSRNEYPLLTYTVE